MSLLCQRRHQRGPYVTKACTNCQQKHLKCSGKAVCKHCTLYNLKCIFIDSGKKRGPKKNHRNHRLFDQNYIFNGTGINFDKTPILFSNTPNLVQSLALFPSGYQLNASQQILDNNFDICFSSNSDSDNELRGILISQEISHFFY
ncbi:10042_t:CDS:1 [Cetraspora pellucida]|uniref:10042_t:CDS:1 n=1 Tax=Cetraspora pellucida TaxID=1433469 RepID=A0A9N8ZM32_9GLOM|nr:10042_t:CDS:1 [Cetraspora pellucida]